jgi:hypothetical protein
MMINKVIKKAGHDAGIRKVTINLIISRVDMNFFA